MSKPDGGPAFPERYDYVNDQTQSWGGLTKREWYAGMALQGWISAVAGLPDFDVYDYDAKAFAEHQKLVAETCFGYADAMLKAGEP